MAKHFAAIACVPLLALIAFTGPSALGQASPPVQSVSTEHTIKPGDELQIYVSGQEALLPSVKVQPDGTIAFASIGSLLVAGKRPEEVQLLISQGLGAHHGGAAPQVTITVSKSTAIEFTILGKVNSPGVFSSPGRSISVIEALAMAGGPAKTANLKDILVLRKVDGGMQAIHLDARRIFKAISKTIDLKELKALQDGDLILVASK
jgi:polysaccharide export outer membrane protein